MGGNSMKNVIRSLVSLAVLLALATAASTSAFAAETSTNWEDGYITVEGYGVAPANARTAGQARAMARRAAQLDAYRNIAEAVQGVNVDGETTVEEAMVTSDVIRTKVSALVKGARIVSEHAESDGSYVVTMRAPLYGIGSVADAVFSVTPAFAIAFWTRAIAALRLALFAFATVGAGVSSLVGVVAAVSLAGSLALFTAVSLLAKAFPPPKNAKPAATNTDAVPTLNFLIPY